MNEVTVIVALVEGPREAVDIDLNDASSDGKDDNGRRWVMGGVAWRGGCGEEIPPDIESPGC